MFEWGDVVMPQGDYEVKHVMEGENHIVVVNKLGGGKAASFRVKCSLVRSLKRPKQPRTSTS
jgi:hypothetical protein